MSDRPTRRNPLAVMQLEDRLVPDGRPLPLPVIYTGAETGAPPAVKAFDALTGAQTFERTVYEAGFTGGVRVATADLTRDGYPDLVVAPGAGGGPRVRVLDGKTGEPLPGPLGGFFAYDPGFLGGVQVAAADVTGDGVPDVVTAAGLGGGPHVRVFSGADGQLAQEFMAYEPDFRGGVSVAAADFTGDGRSEVVVGAGPGGGPRVRVYDLAAGGPLAGRRGDFFAYDAGFRGGVNVGTDWKAGDVTGDRVPDLVVAPGAGMAPLVRLYSGRSGRLVREFLAFDAGMTAGVRVGTAYVTDDAYADVVVATAQGVQNEVRVYDGSTWALVPGPVGSFAPYGPGNTNGIMLAASNDPPGGPYSLPFDQTFYWTDSLDQGPPVDHDTATVREQVAVVDPSTYEWTFTVTNTSTPGSPSLAQYGISHISVPIPDIACVTSWTAPPGWTMYLDPSASDTWAGVGNPILAGQTATFTFRTPPRPLVDGWGTAQDWTVEEDPHASGWVVGPGKDASLRVESVTFETTHPAIVCDPDADGNSVVYSGPQYLDSNLDGDALDPGERAYPTSFTRNEYLTVSATFRTPAGVGGSTVRVRGTAPGGITLPATQVAVSAAGLATVSHLRAQQPFADRIDAYPDFRIDWEYTTDPAGQVGWTSSGASRDELYVTLAVPTATTQYHTLIWQAATALKGMNSNDGLADCLFHAVYAGLNVRTKQGNLLYYYKEWVGAAVRLDRLLVTKNGQCSAWAEHFVEEVAAIGGTRPAAPYLMITPTAGDGFLLNDAVFCEGPIGLNQPGYPGVFPIGYDYFNSYKKPAPYDTPYNKTAYVWGNADFTSESVSHPSGPPGQNNSDPLSLFNRHVIVLINGVRYDPSYGVTYASLQQFDDRVGAFFKGPTELRPAAGTGNQDRRYVYFFRPNPDGLGVAETASANPTGG